MFVPRTLAVARGLLLLLPLLGACRPARETVPPAETPGPASDLQRAYDLPRTDVAWTARDYIKARDVLVRLERERPELLPRLDGPDAALMARLTGLADIEAAAGGVADTDELLAFSQAGADILHIYSARALTRGEYGREYVAVAVAYFKLGVLQFEAILAAEKLDEAALRANDVRREAFVEVRFQLARGVHDVLASALALPRVIDPAYTAATLTPIAADVAPWFLPEERDRILDLADRLAAAGVPDPDLATLRTAFAPDREAHPIVDAFAEEHREFLDKKEALFAAVAAGDLAPVDLGREGEWTRWAFPEAGFSAAFPLKPNAQKQSHTATDGVAMTTRMLGLKQAGRISRLASCITRAQPIAGRTRDDDVKSIAAMMHLERLRPITVEGAAGLEGSLTTDTAHGLIRVVGLSDRTSCIVSIDVPRELARELEGEMRRFVDSFRPAGFRD
ncbi:hypothetical protein [Nannocystis sp. SCPEA4]|uniref:hypothetical protein n=1 Tax=Nannocystis sp. SCPEA4 TaxID=2996787 RepID=UPI00226D8319|nr:hypothetical protein [Nannocystis sp. SCPEA4]MCY1053475.1 hypothetical protein [Nannocystis sp. SCPEA4]